MRRTPLRATSSRRRAQQIERVAFLKRAHGPMVCAVPHCGQAAVDAHEPLTRGRGGSITDPDNIVPLCRPHHDDITDHEPPWAYELGLLRHSWEPRP